MFTASLNLEALKKITQGSPRTCAAEGCEQPVPQTDAQYCSDHSKQRAQRSRRTKKASR